MNAAGGLGAGPVHSDATYLFVNLFQGRFVEKNGVERVRSAKMRIFFDRETVMDG